MIGLLRAENRKIAATRMTWILLASTVALSLMYVLSYGLLAGVDLGEGVMIPGVEAEMTVRLIYSGIAMGAYVIAIVFGIVNYTAELRHRTVTLTLLVTPHRWRVVAAKFATSALWGAIFAVIDLAICLPVAMWLINSKPNHWQLPTADLVTVGIGTVVGFALYAALGVALGALLRNQIAAIVGTLAWVMIVEAIFMALLPVQGKWLPGGAMAALAESRALNGVAFLTPTQGGLLLLAYALVIGAVASLTSVRRDVT